MKPDEYTEILLWIKEEINRLNEEISMLYGLVAERHKDILQGRYRAGEHAQSIRDLITDIETIFKTLAEEKRLKR